MARPAGRSGRWTRSGRGGATVRRSPCAPPSSWATRRDRGGVPDAARLDGRGAARPRGLLQIRERGDGARSNALPDHVPEEVKEERWHRFMEKAQAISEAKLAAGSGSEMEVIVDAVDAGGRDLPHPRRCARDRRQSLHRRGLRRAGAGRPDRRSRWTKRRITTSGAGSSRTGQGDAMIHVSTTCDSLKTAQMLARAALEMRLAACANIVPGVVSLFHWQGRDRRGGGGCGPRFKDTRSKTRRSGRR